MSGKKMKEDQKVLFPEKRVWDLTRKFIKFSFSRKNEKENLLQYIIRQFYIPDSKGNPSMTVTLTFYVMVLIGIVTYIECVNALKSGAFSVSFMSLVIALSVVITAAYRNRQKGIQETDDQVIYSSATEIATKAKNVVSNVISKVTGGGK